MSTEKNTITWPEVFIKGTTEETNPALLCAMGLSGWAICMSGIADDIPENFGTGMALIGQRMGVSATPESLMEWSNNPDNIKNNTPA